MLPLWDPVSATSAFYDVSRLDGGSDKGKEKKKEFHSSILAWRIPWTEEPGRLQSMSSQRVGHELSDSAHTHASRLCISFLFLNVMAAVQHNQALQHHVMT